MKSGAIITAGACGLLLTACQSLTYEKVGYGPPLEYAKAECEIGAMGVEQGYFAMGSSGYVLGAAIGNAIGNEIRKQQYVQRCMVLQGWHGVPAGHAEAQDTTQRSPHANTTPAPQAAKEKTHRRAPAVVKDVYSPSTPSNLGSVPGGQVVAKQ